MKKTSKLKFKEIHDNSDVDIAIIGAGISGLYCAYRLINDAAFKDKKIAIFERLNRTGGRLQSDLIPIRGNHEIHDENKIGNYYSEVHIDFVKEEQGGMRFNYSMDELMTLNKNLKLCDQIVPFPMSSTGDTNRFCIRGHSFSVNDANDGGNMIWSQLYNLNPEEIGLSPVQIITNAYYRILEANDIKLKEDQTPEYWQKFRLLFKWNDIPMYKWQLWGLLLAMGYSGECVEMLTDTIGFEGPFQGMPNAGDAWQILADFPKDPHYYTFKDGFSTLPNEIVKSLEGKVAIYQSSNVDSISGSEGDFSMMLTEAPEGQSSQPIIPKGKYKKVKASQIISAVAATGFKSLYLNSPSLHTKTTRNDAGRLWESINGVLGMKLMKINFYFKEAWWYNESTGRPKIEFGPNFSDLPINAIYPFYSVNDLKVNAEKGTVSINTAEAPAALTLYCDFNNTNFWKGLQNVGPKFTSPIQEKYNHKKPQTSFAASQAVVAEARKQMGLLFGVTNVPEPVFTSYRLWNGEDDFEYAYHQWQLDVDDKKTIDYFSNPIAGFYMCNEAISDMQGWVNGSLRSANLALSKISEGSIKPLSNKPCETRVKSTNDKKIKRVKFTSGYWGS